MRHQKMVVLDSRNTSTGSSKMYLWNLVCQQGGRDCFERESGVKIKDELMVKMLFISFTAILMRWKDQNMRSGQLVDMFATNYALDLSEQARTFLRKIAKFLIHKNFESEAISQTFQDFERLAPPLFNLTYEEEGSEPEEIEPTPREEERKETLGIEALTVKER